ncbi:MAG: class I mannose-6-phosphate isomerase [Bryobacteraceae bacterium]
MTTNYDKFPRVLVTANDGDCATGWAEVVAQLSLELLARPRCVLVIECYPGVDLEEVQRELVNPLIPQRCILAAEALKSPAELDSQFAECLGQDAVFGKMQPWSMADFLSAERISDARSEVRSSGDGLTVILGTGATAMAEEWDLLIYADLARWEIQRRQREHRVGNLGAENSSAPPSQLYKRAYFVDWRAADRTRHDVFEQIDYLLDTNVPDDPRMISGELYRAGLERVCHRPFRVVPFFDPGPWGGEWMRTHFDLPSEPPNFAWCFDCVPEENSLRLGFGSRFVELPASTLVHQHPRELLGEDIVRRFGAEFPIRFDLLDTVGGGNLSLQVHPLPDYIREQFGMPYTQDESYYILDAEADAIVYLGFREGVDRKQFEIDLRAAQEGLAPFPAERYINSWPVRKHAHLSIPAGTIHCSGRNSMVLEISATPYIFTFKLWDWNRPGLDGKPRPIHLDHGLANLQWRRTTDWVRANLVNPITPVANGPGWREESTGLHTLEFLETRRHWFTVPVDHDTHRTVNVLNLVEGDEAIVESPTGAFDAFPVHYAETFIVPAAVGAYRIRPAKPTASPLATMKAFVRKARP